MIKKKNWNPVTPRKLWVNVGWNEWYWENFGKEHKSLIGWKFNETKMIFFSRTRENKFVFKISVIWKTNNSIRGWKKFYNIFIIYDFIRKKNVECVWIYDTRISLQLCQNLKINMAFWNVTQETNTKKYYFWKIRN